jgi:hypothetical protein
MDSLWHAYVGLLEQRNVLGIMITNKRQATVTQPHVFSAAVRQCGL